jgi:glycerophosphoryl diester phosphodiesterase
MDCAPLVIAHRGASHDAPENTLAAFRLAWEQGADGVEADFRLTRDGKIVCIHDDTTGRTAGKSVAVADASLAELRRLDVGVGKDERWRGERIPTLEEILAELPAGKRIFIELKAGPEMVVPLRDLLVGSGITPERVRLLAFSPLLVGLLNEQLPEFRSCLNLSYRRVGGVRTPRPDQVAALLAGCRADGLSSAASPLLDVGFVAELRRSGLELHVWTVDSVRTARHYRALGVDSIMTNRPSLVLPVILNGRSCR